MSGTECESSKGTDASASKAMPENAASISMKVSTAFTSSMSFVLACVGHEVGLFAALARMGPCSLHQLACDTGCVEPYVRDWVISQTMAGFISYAYAHDTDTDTIFMTDAQKEVFLDDDSMFYQGGILIAAPDLLHTGIHKVPTEIKLGKGIPWGEHLPQIFLGAHEFTKIMYRKYLIQTWIPAGLPANLMQKLTSTSPEKKSQCFSSTWVAGTDMHVGLFYPSAQNACKVPFRCLFCNMRIIM